MVQLDMSSPWTDGRIRNTVNYEEERMYVGPFACEALVWKGRDVWDVGTWVKLTTMEEIQDYGRDV
jgi:hypothetical protein